MSVPPPQADVIEPTVVVPADLEVDDRLVGPVTFRLAGWLAVVAAGLTLAALSWPAVGPTAAGALLLIVGAAGALIRPAGRPLLWWAGPLWAYRRRQRSRASRPDQLVQPAADAVIVEPARPATESAAAPAHDQPRGYAVKAGSPGMRTPLDEVAPPAQPATTFAAPASAIAAAAPSTGTAPAGATLTTSEARSSSAALSWQTEVEWRAQRRATRRPAVVGLACALAISGGVAIPVRLAGSGHFAQRATHGVDNDTAADQARTASGTGGPTSQPTPSSAPSLSASSPAASPATTAVPSAAVSLLNDLLLGDPLDSPSGGGQPSSSAPSSRASTAPSPAAPSPDSSDDLLPLWLLLFLLDGGSCDSSC